MKRVLVALALLFALTIPTHAQLFGDLQSITVVDSGTACVTAPTACATYQLDSASASVSLSVSGTWTGTLTFEGTNNGSVWTSITAYNLATGTGATTTTASGLFAITNAGVIKLRLRATAAVTGTALVTAARGTGVITGPGGSVGATGQFLAADGTAAAPSYAFTSTPGQGILLTAGTTGVHVGTGTAVAALGGTLFTSTTATSTTGLVEETLLSYTLPAATLAVNGRGVRITAAGAFAANANAKTVKAYFGATDLTVNFLASTFNGGGWRVTAEVFRTAAATQVAEAFIFGITSGRSVQPVTPAETLSGTVLIKVTGTTPTTIGDITQNYLLVEAI